MNLKKNLLLNTLDRSQKKKRLLTITFLLFLRTVSVNVLWKFYWPKKKKKVPLKNLGFYNVREF